MSIFGQHVTNSNVIDFVLFCFFLLFEIFREILEPENARAGADHTRLVSRRPPIGRRRRRRDRRGRRA